VGRHIRPDADFKLIIGRNEGENHFLESYRSQFTSIKPISHLGPFTLMDGKITPVSIRQAAQIAARFSDARPDDMVTLEINTPNNPLSILSVPPFTADQIHKEWYISA
jgi:predicted ribosome quality control (RQC) complex YloA/Tae2 family protein